MDSNELKRSIRSAQEAIYALANEVSKTGEDINDADAESLRRISLDLGDLCERNLNNQVKAVNNQVKAEFLRHLLDAEQVIVKYRYYGRSYGQIESCISLLEKDGVFAWL